MLAAHAFCSWWLFTRIASFAIASFTPLLTPRIRVKFDTGLRCVVLHCGIDDWLTAYRGAFKCRQAHRKFNTSLPEADDAAAVALRVTPTVALAR